MERSIKAERLRQRNSSLYASESLGEVQLREAKHANENILVRIGILDVENGRGLGGDDRIKEKGDFDEVLRSF